MIPKFKFYFYPFLCNLEKRETCRLYDLARYIGQDLKLTEEDLLEYTKGGRVTKHNSRVNYCASYLKRMKLVETFSVGAYRITEKGREVLQKYGAELTLENLRELPEFIATQINAENTNVVYVKSHKRGNKVISPYICNKNLLKNKNPNIERSVTESFRESLTDKQSSENTKESEFQTSR